MNTHSLEYIQKYSQKDFIKKQLREVKSSNRIQSQSFRNNLILIVRIKTIFFQC